MKKSGQHNRRPQQKGSGLLLNLTARMTRKSSKNPHQTGKGLTVVTWLPTAEWIQAT